MHLIFILAFRIDSSKNVFYEYTESSVYFLFQLRIKFHLFESKDSPFILNVCIYIFVFFHPRLPPLSSSDCSRKLGESIVRSTRRNRETREERMEIFPGHGGLLHSVSRANWIFDRSTLNCRRRNGDRSIVRHDVNAHFHAQI